MKKKKKTTDEPLLTNSKEFLQNESSDSKHHGTSDDNKLTQSENSSDDLGKLSEEGALRYDSSEKEIEMSNNSESESLIHNSMAENTTENLPEINIPIVKSRIGRPKGSNKPFWQFSKSRKSLSLKEKRKRQEENKINKTQKLSSQTEVHRNTMDCKSGETQNEAIEIDDKTDDNDMDFWVRNEMVSLKNDCKIQINSGEMLDDRVILAAQNMLKNQYPNINGFQPTILSQADITFETCRDNMIQILFKGSSQCGHWLTISTVNLKPGYVNVFDSLNLNLDIEVKNQICAILKQESTYVTANRVPIQQQQGSADCGLFAIATAVALCNGYEPNKILFRQDKLRGHLIKCIENGSFTMFPFDVNIRQKKIKSQKIRVYCKCRRPHDNTTMMKCQNCCEWFHARCIESPDDVNAPFFCCEFCYADHHANLDQ